MYTIYICISAAVFHKHAICICMLHAGCPQRMAWHVRAAPPLPRLRQRAPRMYPYAALGVHAAPQLVMPRLLRTRYAQQPQASTARAVNIHRSPRGQEAGGGQAARARPLAGGAAAAVAAAQPRGRVRTHRAPHRLRAQGCAYAPRDGVLPLPTASIRAAAAAPRHCRPAPLPARPPPSRLPSCLFTPSPTFTAPPLFTRLHRWPLSTLFTRCVFTPRVYSHT